MRGDFPQLFATLRPPWQCYGADIVLFDSGADKKLASTKTTVI